MTSEAEPPSLDGSSELSDDLVQYAKSLQKEIEQATNEELKEQTEEKIQEDTQEDIEVPEQRNKKLKVMDESMGEEAEKETVKVAAGETSTDGVDVACSHPMVFKRLCSHCGKIVKDSGSRVPFNYICKDLMVEPSEADKLGKKHMKCFLKDKKLILILDLDHTLINSVYLDNVIEEEEDLLDGDKKDLFQIDEFCMLTKLRPYVHTFLEEAKNMFEIYIYTMAGRDYADEMANLLDPTGVYFPSRVICRSDCTTENQKGLDMVIGPEELMIILDDTEKVWEKHKENLIVIQRYHYFAHSAKNESIDTTKSLTPSNIDESESDGILANILSVLREAHKRFFHQEVGVEHAMRDVRQILPAIKMEILHGCHILLSEEQPIFEKFWKLAEGMGAKCYSDEDDLVTHVVATVSTTMMAEWARDNNKLLVTPWWIEKAHFYWKRQKEEDFTVL